MKVINARLLAAAMHGDEVGLKAILREPGGDALTKTIDMQNALAWAAEGGHEACIRLLLPVSAPWGKDEHGITPLMHAARYGHDACVELLLPVGDALAKCKYGMTALMYAACDGSEACVRLLLPVSDALAPAPGAQGLTALMIAASRGCEACVGILLPMSDILAKDKKGRTASDWAREESYESLAQFIDAYVLSQNEQASIREAVPPGSPRRRATRRV